MTPSNNCIALIKHYEGCELKAYKCPANIPTIGYGSTFYENGAKVKMGDKITQEWADALLMNVLPKFQNIVNKNIKVSLKQNEFDALVSFCFNCGSSETLFNMINNKSPLASITEWWRTHYIKGGGVELEGLKNRRASEAHLFEHGELNFK
jgi:lysozyme